jgi:hypothetical protein
VSDKRTARRGWGIALLLVLALLLMAMPAAAQETVRIEARVTHVAGQNVYLDAGTDNGLAQNDTLTALRNEQALGRLVVVSATAGRAVVGFPDEPFAVTIGDQLVLLKAAAPPEPAPPVTDVPPAAQPERPSILERPAAPARASAALTPSFDGRLQLGTDILSSSTQSTADGPAFGRTFAQPFAALRAAAEGLPGGLRLDANLRAAYRYADPTPYDRPADVRVYQLSLEKAFRGFDLRAGRFYNPYDRFGGYWDGLLLHLGDDDRGAGLAAGFQPDRADEAPSGDLPKFTAFAHHAFAVPTGGDRPLRVEVTALGGQVRPRGDSLQARTFAGFQQTAYAPGLSLTSELLADQDPGTGDWVLSRLGARASVTAAPGLRLNAFALSRRPYLLLDDLQLLLDRSTRVGGGVSYSMQGGPLSGATLRADAAHAATEGQPSTLSFTGGLSLPRLPGAGLGLSADATVWTQDDPEEGTRRGLYGGAGLDRTFGSLYARLGYRYQQSPFLPGEPLVSHGLDALLQVAVTPRVALTLQGSVLQGDRLSSTRLYTVLWYRL